MSRFHEIGFLVSAMASVVQARQIEGQLGRGEYAKPVAVERGSIHAADEPLLLDLRLGHYATRTAHAFLHDGTPVLSIEDVFAVVGLGISRNADRWTLEHPGDATGATLQVLTGYLTVPGSPDTVLATFRGTNGVPYLSADGVARLLGVPVRVDLNEGIVSIGVSEKLPRVRSAMPR